MEGLRQWVPPQMDGYASLFKAVKEQQISPTMVSPALVLDPGREHDRRSPSDRPSRCPSGPRPRTRPGPRGGVVPSQRQPARRGHQRRRDRATRDTARPPRRSRTRTRFPEPGCGCTPTSTATSPATTAAFVPPPAPNAERSASTGCAGSPVRRSQPVSSSSSSPAVNHSCCPTSTRWSSRMHLGPADHPAHQRMLLHGRRLERLRRMDREPAGPADQHRLAHASAARLAPRRRLLGTRGRRHPYRPVRRVPRPGRRHARPDRGQTNWLSSATFLERAGHPTRGPGHPRPGAPRGRRQGLELTVDTLIPEVTVTADGSTGTR